MLRRVAAIAIGFSLLGLTACGGSAQPSQTAPAPSGGSASAPAAQPKALPQAQISVAVDTLSFAPMWVAQEEGLFQKHGVDVKTVLMQGGGPAVQALVSGSVQFTATDSSALPETHSHGIPDTIAVETVVNRLTLDMIVRKALIDKLHLTRQMALGDRLKVMDGANIGITSAGAASEVYARYFMQKAGLDQKKAKFIAIGNGAPMIAAMKQGQVDVTWLSPPTGQQANAESAGDVVACMACGDDPSLGDFPYEIILSSKKYAQAHPDVEKAVASAIAEGGNLMHSDPAKALADLQKHYNKLDPQVLKSAVEAVTAAVPQNGRTTEQGWQKAVQIDKDAGIVKGDLSAITTKEGDMWTNQYLPQ